MKTSGFGPRRGGAKRNARSRVALAIAGAAALVLAAAPPIGATGAETQTTNATPAVGAAYFYASDPSAGAGATCPVAARATAFNPTSGSTTTIYVCVEASDANGYEDICDSGGASASDARVFSVTDSADVSISDAGHVKANVALTCATGSGTAVALTGSFQMEYWRPAASGASGYKVKPTVTDVQAASSAAYTQQFDYNSLTSLDQTTTGTINLGNALAPGDTGAEQTVAIYNKGNTAFTVHASGTSLTGTTYARTIAVANLKWAASASVAYGTKTALTGTSATTGVSAPAETSDTTTARNVYIQLAVPAGSSQWMPADTYSGTVTFATS